MTDPRLMCMKCGYRWLQRTIESPKKCPKCQRLDWREAVPPPSIHPTLTGVDGEPLAHITWPEPPSAKKPRGVKPHLIPLLTPPTACPTLLSRPTAKYEGMPMKQHIANILVGVGLILGLIVALHGIRLGPPSVESCIHNTVTTLTGTAYQIVCTR